jgi:hypothetical protein
MYSVPTGPAALIGPAIVSVPMATAGFGTASFSLLVVSTWLLLMLRVRARRLIVLDPSLPMAEVSFDREMKYEAKLTR